MSAHLIFKIAKSLLLIVLLYKYIKYDVVLEIT